MYKGNSKVKIPAALHLETGKKLSSGIEKSWRIDPKKVKWNSPDNLLIEKMRENLYRFSGAKTVIQLKEYNKLLKDKAGKLVSFNLFKSKALKVNEKYNVNYLNTEYNNSVSSAQNASNWLRFQDSKDIFPNLQYDAILDERTRDEHASLDGIIKPINDSFWNTHYPPNGWGCRCDALQTDKKPKGAAGKKIAGAVQEGFKNNVGKTGEVFTDKHPYHKGATKKPTANDYGLKSVKSKYKGLKTLLLV